MGAVHSAGTPVSQLHPSLFVTNLDNPPGLSGAQVQPKLLCGWAAWGLLTAGEGPQPPSRAWLPAGRVQVRARSSEQGQGGPPPASPAGQQPGTGQGLSGEACAGCRLGRDGPRRTGVTMAMMTSPVTRGAIASDGCLWGWYQLGGAWAVECGISPLCLQSQCPQQAPLGAVGHGHAWVLVPPYETDFPGDGLPIPGWPWPWKGGGHPGLLYSPETRAGAAESFNACPSWSQGSAAAAPGAQARPPDAIPSSTFPCCSVGTSWEFSATSSTDPAASVSSWTSVAQSQLTATSASRFQVILPPQPPR
uniref:uncharacterized protein LOC128928304 isoform X2 n=1 Tax=Callithrix jacchus TaxID=9483 RepID=UPI0023DD18BE|nr:uncharacterized protein LOC128928304 isoform X2 [Callithrix jacchus]